MTKKLLFGLFCIVLASCATQKPLYTWYNYGQTTYDYLKKNDEESLNKLITEYQKIIKLQKGTRKVPPPGVYADYGFLLLQANRTEEGKQMLEMEMTNYPESKIFIERILKMMED